LGRGKGEGREMYEGEKHYLAVLVDSSTAEEKQEEEIKAHESDSHDPRNEGVL
jgi:hypothetical protein